MSRAGWVRHYKERSVQPRQGWTPENIETMARYLAENYFIDEDGSQQPRRSEEDAYEEWKMCAASLGVPRTGSMEYPGAVTKRVQAIREEMANAEILAAAAPELLAIIVRWKADLLGANPDFNDPKANEVLARLGVE